VLGDLASPFIDGHDGVADLVFSKFPEDIGSIFEHPANDMGSFVKSGVGNLFRREDGKGFDDEGLFVEGLEVEAFTKFLGDRSDLGGRGFFTESDGGSNEDDGGEQDKSFHLEISKERDLRRGILRYESSKSPEKIRALRSSFRVAFKCLGRRREREGECGLHWNGKACPGPY
jgi:hypothetical protein